MVSTLLKQLRQRITFIQQSTTAISSIANDKKGNDGSIPLNYPRLDSLRPDPSQRFFVSVSVFHGVEISLYMFASF